MVDKKKLNSTVATLEAAGSFTRRVLLKGAVAAGAAAAVGPWYVSNALSSSGELSLLNWDDELPDPVIPDFEKATGIKVKTTPFSQNEEQINKLQAAGGDGFDLCQPTHDRAPQFKDLAVLQPFDEKKLTLDSVLPSMVKISEGFWRWDGKLYHVPHTWGSEAISWRTDLTKIEYKTLSYGSLWKDEYKGKVQGRPHSLLLGIGLWMDATGQLKSNRMLDAYKDEATMKSIYDKLLKFAIEKKPWIKQFWDSADNTKSGLLENGVVIGQTWDGPPLGLKKAGKPVSYMAPQEGAITWLDGWAMSKGAKNIDQAYAWLKYCHSKEASAKVADGSGYNPVAKGADELLSPAAKKNFQEAYPDDALSKLWQRPLEPSWFAELRTQYAEKFKAA
ncbi:MAG: extracellular solute-binding protein [Hyphomicrobiales bacterium]|jgi:spermidine/putrescine transport system substrate-binding protein|nr:extracellular solute-binding protein [Hyphomicrobiales bacterium]NBR11943.1 extracellular solute-binding protein [Alphaproteobacteria bacterium]